MSASYELILSDDDELAVARRVMTKRQFRLWSLCHRENKTVYGAVKFLNEHNEYQIGLRTAQYELRRARQALTDEIAEMQKVMRNGQVRLGITVEQSDTAQWKPDTVLKQVVHRLQFVDLQACA